LKARKWIGKDIILIAFDYKYGDEGLKSWLQYYYHENTKEVNIGFPRGGAIQAALNIDINPSEKFDNVIINLVGSNGQLPNLDLVNTASRISRRLLYGDQTVSLFKQDFYNFKFFPFQLEMLTLIRFILNQAIGVPDGDHGLFNIYHVDAITLNNNILNSNTSVSISMMHFGRYFISFL
jgi:glycosylphosphatidylinositol transamidase